MLRCGAFQTQHTEVKLPRKGVSPPSIWIEVGRKLTLSHVFATNRSPSLTIPSESAI